MSKRKKRNKKLIRNSIIGVLLIGIIVLIFLSSLTQTIFKIEDRPTSSKYLVYSEDGIVKTKEISSSGFLQAVFQVSCTPSSGYKWCDAYGNYDGASNSYIKLDTSGGVLGNYKDGHIVGDAYFKAKASGDGIIKLYKVDNFANSWSEFWNKVNCGASGCTNLGNAISNPTTKILASEGQTYKGCPIWVGFSGVTASNGDWSYVMSAHGWIGNDGNCLTISPVECVDDSDCGNSMVCKSFNCEEQCEEVWSCGSWGPCIGSEQTRTCTDSNNCQTYYLKPKTTQSCVIPEEEETYYRFSNNKCTEIELLPSEKTTNDYTTISQCESNIVLEEKEILVYRLENNECNSYTIDESEKKDSDYTSLTTCKNDISSGDEPLPTKTFNYIPYLIAGIVLILLTIIFIIVRRKNK